MKRVFNVIGIIFLVIVVLLNICLTANLDASEHITISFNNFFCIIGLIITGLIIYFASNALNKYLYKDDKKKKLRKILFISAISIYIIADILWTIFVRAPIVGDQVHVNSMGQLFYRGYDEEIINSNTYAGIPLGEYIQAYNQQIPQAFLYSIFFKIIHIDEFGTPRALNVIAIIIILIAIYKIGNIISKKHKVNKVRLMVLFLTFLSLPMLSTFVYGDIQSLAFALLSVYYMMKFVSHLNNKDRHENNFDANANNENSNVEKDSNAQNNLNSNINNLGAIIVKEKVSKYLGIKYFILSTIFSMIAYMFRMNSLIFVIATAMYLLFNLFTKITSKTAKENITNTLVIVIFIIVSILPAQFVNDYYINKYNLDKTKAYPNISYILMGMSESWRGNGWYNESIGEPALKNPQGIKEEYENKIKDRLTYFSQNIGYTFRFYTMKLASMWSENTYSAVRLNLLHESEDDYLNVIKEPLNFYQKALLILMCVCSIIVLIQNRKNLSPEIIYLLLIFMGGFAFHILWEAKSRYIIPYIVVLIPIASVQIFRKKSKNKPNMDEN